MFKTKQKNGQPDAPPLSLPLYSTARFWLKVIVLLQLVIMGLEFSPALSTNGDDAVYYLLGKSLVSGNGYRELFSPDNAIHTQYPPLFPVLLGSVGFFSTTPLVPKIVVGLIAVGCVLLLVLLLYKIDRQNGALPLALFFVFSWSMASHATLLMSEIPFLAATLTGFILYEMSRQKPESRLLFWMAIVAALLPIMIRSIGIAFIGALFCTMLLDKRYKQAALLLLLCSGSMALLLLYSQESSPYIDQLLQRNSYNTDLGSLSFVELLFRIRQNINLYCLQIVPTAMLGKDLPASIVPLVGAVFTVFTAVGIIGNIRGRYRSIGLYTCMYAAIISMWQQQWTSSRFLIPLVPLLAYFFVTGFYQSMVMVLKVPCEKQERLFPRVVWILVAVLVIPNVVSHVQYIKAPSALTLDWQNFYSCADWVRLHTPPKAVVISRKPELLYVRSNRVGCMYPFSYDVEKVIEGIRKSGATYCILDNFVWTKTSACYLFPAIQAHPEMFRVVYSLSNPETYVLEIRPASR